MHSSNAIGSVVPIFGGNSAAPVPPPPPPVPTDRLYNVELVGVVDGVNKVFSMARFVANTQVVTENGLRLRPGGHDYTIGGSQVGAGYDLIIFTAAPQPKSVLLVDYQPSL